MGELSGFDSGGFPAFPVLRTSMERIEAQYSEISELILDLQSRKSVLQFQVSDQERRTVELRATARRRDGADPARSELVVAERRLRELREELDDVRRQLAEAEQEKAALQREVDELREIDAYALNNFHWAQHEKRRADRLEVEVRSLRARLADLEREVADLRTRAATVDADVEGGQTPS